MEIQLFQFSVGLLFIVLGSHFGIWEIVNWIQGASLDATAAVDTTGHAVVIETSNTMKTWIARGSGLFLALLGFGIMIYYGFGWGQIESYTTTTSPK